MIYKIIIGDSNLLIPHELDNKDDKIILYCNKLVEFKIKNHKDNFEISIKHKQYKNPTINILLENKRINDSTEILNLFNKIIINIKK
jgi:hypothetical protein